MIIFYNHNKPALNKNKTQLKRNETETYNSLGTATTLNSSCMKKERRQKGR